MSRRRPGAHGLKSPVTYMVTLLLGVGIGIGLTRFLSRPAEACQAAVAELGRHYDTRLQELERTLLASFEQQLAQLPRQLAEHTAKPPAPEPAPEAVARRLSYKGNTYDTYEVDLTQARLRFFYQQPDGTPFHSLDALRGWLQARGE